jgi:hypothetical protein
LTAPRAPANNQPMPTNIEKLAEELSAIVAPYPNPLDCTGVKISRRGGKHRIVMGHFIGPNFKFTFDFERVLPFDPAGGKGKTDDVFADAKISLSSPHGPPPDNPTKKEVDRYCALYLRLVYAVLRKEARAGRISSKTLADMQVRMPRKDDMDAAARDMIAVSPNDIVDATSAQNADQFVDEFLSKDSPALAAAIKRDLWNEKKKKYAARKSRKK